MGSGQSTLEGKSLDEQAILVESRSETEAQAEADQTAKSISLDWDHPTRQLSDFFTMLSNKPIGRGHFADVYLGQVLNEGRPGLNLKVGELVAIKCVYRSRCSEDNLRKEVDALLNVATRHHPNIVSLLDAFLTADKLYLVLEYCAGGELFEHLAGEGPYSESQASEIIKQMAHVLHFLHSHNVVHRDLKPENILLATTEGDIPQVKVADFGLATMKKEPFMTSVCGTWAYCAPEVRGSQCGPTWHCRDSTHARTRARDARGCNAHAYSKRVRFVACAYSGAR
jgi:serine/threonine protein kinase